MEREVSSPQSRLSEEEEILRAKATVQQQPSLPRTHLLLLCLPEGCGLLLEKEMPCPSVLLLESPGGHSLSQP